MSRGVPAGASSAVQVYAWNPGTPASSVVGTPGSRSDGRAEAILRTRNDPAWNRGAVAASVPNPKVAWPPITSIRPGISPLYGTCTALVFVAILNDSPATWVGLPMPEDTKPCLSGLFLSSSISSACVFTGRWGSTVRRSGTLPLRAPAWTSFTESYGSDLYSVWLMECASVVTRNV